MKKYIITLTLGSLLFCSSCKDFLEVQPEFKFFASVGTSSLDKLGETTTGAFNALQAGNLFGGGMIANSELLADNIVVKDPIPDFSLNQLRGRQLNSFNGQAIGLWGDGYRAINIANIVLENLPLYEEEDPIMADSLRGECLFIRGICHFEMLRMFAQPSGYTADDSHPGIPIRLFPGSSDSGVAIPRSSVAEVYDQVVLDLTDAYNLLPDDRTSRASKWAAAGYLMKVYFQRNDFANALVWADEIINSGQFELNTDVTANYDLAGPEWTKETIFQSINSVNDISNGDLGRFRANVMYELNDALIQVMESRQLINDTRASGLFRNFFDIAWFTKKYDNGEMNVPVLRLAEVYITRAECKAELGMDPAEIRSDYNQLRVRAGLPADENTSEIGDLKYIVQYERNLELAMEGDRFHDLKRRKADFNTQMGVYAWNDPILVYPIPQQELDTNPNMEQNEGY